MSKILKVVGASWLQTKISSYVLGILGVLAILALFLGQIERIQDGNYAATVFYSEKTGYRIEYWGQSNELADISKGVARAYFRMDINNTGWSLLEVETDGSYPDEIQAYAAGIVEGALTWYSINSHLENTIKAKCEGTPLEKQCNKLRDALDRSVDTWKNYAADRSGVDPYWHHVSLHYTQISGIYTGWSYGVHKSTEDYNTDISDLYWLNSMAEVTELQHKLNITLEDPVLDALPDASSAFIRVVTETDDGTPRKKLYVSQNAAGPYSSMTRILKRYKLNYHLTSMDTKSVPGTIVNFSGYPGSVTSQDEFYVIKGENHQMVVTGTKLKNYNSKIWKDVDINKQVPAGPRISAANHLASNISSWAHILARSNSGTASKQWLVIDFTKFDDALYNMQVNSSTPVRNETITEKTVNEDVKHTVVYRANNGHVKGVVGLIEQVPGWTHSADISDSLLESGYWATYGLPFFKDIAEITHVNKMEAMYGRVFSEVESPRAVIFKRGFKNATNLESIIELMRQNNITAMYGANNETECDNELECIVTDNGYWAVVGVRGDIVRHHREAYGVIDTKIVSGTCNDSSLEFIAISGPPYSETEENVTEVLINKGNLAPIYTKQFDNEPTINSIEIRDLVKQQQEEAEQETLELLNKNAVKPFAWSESEFANNTRQELPDKWAFKPFIPNWSW